MSDDRKERLSAVVDSELDAQSGDAIDNMLKTPELRAAWARYHLIRDSLQQKLPEGLDTGLAGRIAERIADEPHIIATAGLTKNTYLKPVAGFAIAASVATMAILGIQQQPGETGLPGQGVVSTTSPAGVSSLSARPASLRSSSNEPLRQLNVDDRTRLNSYLVNYNEYRSKSGFQGMLPYARTVTFENGR